MTLSSRKVGLIVSLVVAALGGLIALQVSLLNYAMELKEQAFRRNVMAALGQVSHGLETGEAIMFVIASDTANQLRIDARMNINEETDRGVIHGFDRQVMIVDSTMYPSPPVWTEGDSIHYSVGRPQRVLLKVLDLTTGLDTVYIDSFHQPGVYCLPVAREHSAGDGVFWQYRTDSASMMMQLEGSMPKSLAPFGPSDSGKYRLVTSVVQNLVDTEFEPIEARLDSLNVDSIIAGTLDDNGIDLEYAYGVITEFDDSLRIAKPGQYAREIRESEYKVRLFPHDVFASHANLALYFPGRAVYLWGQMGPLMGATVVLMLIVIGCFAYTIRTILRQRRFAGMMVDFINNMTHEFKTPISTVALAAEAIRRPDVVDEPDKVLRFTEMIESENRRMSRQAEKILQMAALEKDDVELSFSDVDLHELIKTAVKAADLQVGKRDGNVICFLEAKTSIVRGDKVHLANVIHNLLDNANKYSPDSPQITVRTFDSSRGVGIRIEDRGRGLRPEDQKRVFEKYFRVPTGNVHDVKGFGLGLSYVKLIVEAHDGTIELNSKLGEGTEVEVILPVRGDGDQA